MFQFAPMSNNMIILDLNQYKPEKSKKDSKRYQNIRKWKAMSFSHGAKHFWNYLCFIDNSGTGNNLWGLGTGDVLQPKRNATSAAKRPSRANFVKTVVPSRALWIRQPVSMTWSLRSSRLSRKTLHVQREKKLQPFKCPFLSVCHLSIQVHKNIQKLGERWWGNPPWFEGSAELNCTIWNPPVCRLSIVLLIYWMGLDDIKSLCKLHWITNKWITVAHSCNLGSLILELHHNIAVMIKFGFGRCCHPKDHNLGSSCFFRKSNNWLKSQRISTRIEWRNTKLTIKMVDSGETFREKP